MVSLHTDQELWTDAVINGAVSDHIDEQSRHPKALNTGINDEKAFDTSSRKGKQADDAGEDSSIETAVKPRKKRKKRKPKGQRKGTGFEENYADAPLTPQHYEEEKGLYDVSRPFIERVETAIQRYVSKRNFDSDRRNLFDRFLTFGGIEGGPKMFSGGLDPSTLAKSDAAEIAALTATQFVDPKRNEDSLVDFQGCLKAFLGSRLAAHFDIGNKESLEMYIGVIRNFLNYLLHHDVCPEYKHQVEASRKLCDQAQREVWNIVQAQRLLPGSFNMACSVIFGGTYRELQVPEIEDWMDEKDRQHFPSSMDSTTAPRTFRIGMLAYASDELISKYKAAKAKAEAEAEKDEKKKYPVISKDVDLVVTNITLGAAMPKIRDLYNTKEGYNLPVLGNLQTRTWQNPGALEEDLTAEEEETLLQNPQASQEYNFWLDDELLQKLCVGMKLETTVKEVDFGIYYFDTVQMLRASFYSLLPNELMIGWKRVEDEWLPPRPTTGDDEHSHDPSIENGDAKNAD